MAIRVQKAQEEARLRLQQEIESSNAQIITLQRQLEIHEDTLAKLNATEEEAGELLALDAQARKDPREIAAEDALDTIVRLENTLKVVQRRNVLLGRENSVQEKTLKDRMKILAKLNTEEEQLIHATGWNESVSGEDAVELRERIAEMVSLEQTLTKELTAAQVLVKKKEQAVEVLQNELDSKIEKEEQLALLFNSIRVTDRDCVETQRSIDDLTNQHRESQALIEVARSKRGTMSIQCLQDDAASLKSIVETHRQTRRNQDDIIKAQIWRARQLQTRIDIITAALKDMKLDREFERSIPKSSLVPGAAKDEPTNVDQVIPDNEVIPLETFLLLVRDNETMRTGVARKDVMVLEKEATIQALEAKLEGFTHSLNLSTEQQDNIKINKAIEMDELQETLQQQHQAYRRQIEELLSANLRLKSKLTKQQAAPVPLMSDIVARNNSRMRY